MTRLFAYIRLLAGSEAVDAWTPTLDHIAIDRTGQVEEDARAIRILRQRVPAPADALELSGRPS